MKREEWIKTYGYVEEDCLKYRREGFVRIFGKRAGIILYAIITKTQLPLSIACKASGINYNKVRYWIKNK